MHSLAGLFTSMLNIIFISLKRKQSDIVVNFFSLKVTINDKKKNNSFVCQPKLAYYPSENRSVQNRSIVAFMSFSVIIILAIIKKNVLIKKRRRRRRN